MATSGTETEAGPEVPAPEKKTSWGKIIAVVIVLVVIIAAVAAWRLMTPPSPPENRAPTITSVTADRGGADIAQTVTFTAAATDPDNDPVTYAWNFGDGGTAAGATVTHAYGLAGNFIAVVTVSDDHNHNVSGYTNPVFLLVNHPETRTPPGPPPGNSTKPVAVLSANNSIVQAGQAVVKFIGNASWTWAYDDAAAEWAFMDAASNATAMPYLNWTWGDGGTSNGAPTVTGTISHTFATQGTYLVRLNVTNYLFQKDEVGYTVVVTQAAPPTGIVKNPDVFTEVVFGEPDSLDPAYDYETSGGQVIQNVAESLIWYQRQYADRFVPMLVDRIPSVTTPADVSPDGMIWNFTLKSGLKFHSGNTVNCRAVEWSFERVLVINDPDGPAWIYDQSLTDYAADDPATPTVDERLVAIQNSVTCPDGPTGLKVQFHLAKAYPAFLSTLAFTAGSVIDPAPGSYHVSGRCPVPTDLYNNTCHDQLVGTGAYKLRVWQPNQQIILDRWSQYWRTQANFKEVHIIKANDIATRVLMLKAGDADSIALSPDHKNDIRDGTGNFLPGLIEYSGDTFVVQFLGMNQAINVTGAPPGDIDVPTDFFADINIRKAFAYAWDYTGFINNVLYGYGTPLCGPIPKGMFGYDATVPCYIHDLVKSQQYFQAALDPRTPAPTDTYWDNGFTITVYYNIGNLGREEGARMLKTILETMNTNFHVKVQGLEWASFLDTVRSRIPSFFFLGWAPDYADPDDYVVPFLRTGGTFPRQISYSNTSLDALINAQAVELNQTIRLNTLKQIQWAPYYDVPFIFRNQAKSQNVFRQWVTGFYENPMTFSGTGNYYYDLDK